MEAEARRPPASGRQSFEIHDRLDGRLSKARHHRRRRRASASERRRRRRASACVLGSRRRRAPCFSLSSSTRAQHTNPRLIRRLLWKKLESTPPSTGARAQTERERGAFPSSSPFLPLSLFSSRPVPPRRSGGGGADTSSSTACTARSIRSSHVASSAARRGGRRAGLKERRGLCSLPFLRARAPHKPHPRSSPLRHHPFTTSQITPTGLVSGGRSSPQPNSSSR